MDSRRYIPHLAVSGVALLFLLGSCAYNHAIVYERPASEPVQTQGKQFCSAPGFCYHTEYQYDMIAGESRYVSKYGFYHSCPGKRAAIYTKQRFAYERRNGKTGERTRTLDIQPIEDCQV